MRSPWSSGGLGTVAETRRAQAAPKRVCRPPGSMCRAQGNVCRPQGSRCRLQGSVCRPQGNVCRARGNVCRPQGNGRAGLGKRRPGSKRLGPVSQRHEPGFWFRGPRAAATRTARTPPGAREDEPGGGELLRGADDRVPAYGAGLRSEGRLAPSASRSPGTEQVAEAGGN